MPPAETGPAPRQEMPAQAPERAPAEAPSRPETVLPAPETAAEQAQPAVTAQPAMTSPEKSESLRRIESILEEDVADFYMTMPPDKQAEFKRVGEETATQIDRLLAQAKVHVKKIIDLITRWLRLIPHVNTYFLEQEAKIKTDKLLKNR